MGNCLGQGDSTNPGAVLDRVISQANNDDDCLLYKLADYKKRGELMDAYNVGGAMEVEKLIREQFGILMYREGRGQIISRTEYLRWRFRNQKHVVIPVEPTSLTDPLAKWQDHEACWQMQYRGSLGETLLHVLIICDTRLHTRLARILLKCFPKLALDVVEGEEYLGASSLHLAIAYNNNDLIHLLVECGAKIEQRAVGSFFLPKDQQRVKPAKFTEYEGLAYLGEYPLAWAACMGHESVYNLLLESGAHPDWQDSYGNMILHMVVVTDQLGMYGYALRHPRIVASSSIINNQGLTPLTLACRLGRASVFREMLELSCREFWRYSNITCSAYPLNALDTIMPDGRTNWNSALFMILAGSKEEHLDMLDGGIIQRLLEEKWKTFAQRQFIKRISIAAAHILVISMAVYLRPGNPSRNIGQYEEAKDVVRLCFEMCSIFGSVYYVIFQQGEEIKNQGLVSFVKQLPTSPPKLVFLFANFLLLSCIPLRMSGDERTEEAILSVALVGIWFFLMFFAGAVKLTGPFVTMVYSMIAGDMLTFGIIFVIFLLGFSQSFYYLYKSHPLVNNTLFDEYHTTWMALYQMTLGSYDYGKLSETGYPNMAKAVFIIFMIMVPILLLNMLIAMMGNTYSQVIERSEKEWIKQWAKLVVALERSVSQEDAKKYIQEYSIKLGGTDPSNEVRGVMVIKQKAKTRASQRKGALSNWKRVGKVTINALKKRGMTGEEMRLLMWGHRNSVCTPQNATPRQQSMDVGAINLVQPGMGVEAGLLAAGLDNAIDQLQFANVDSLMPQGPGDLTPMVTGTTTVTTTTTNVTTSTAPTPMKPLTTTIPGTSSTSLTVSTTTSTITPTSPIVTSSTSQVTPTTSIVASHIVPEIEKSPVKKPQKKRATKFGLKPKIIIFSDQRDLLRANLESDDSECEDFYNTTESMEKEAPVMQLPSVTQASSFDSSGTEDDDVTTTADTNVKSQSVVGQPPRSLGVVNFAFEPEEFAAAEKTLTKIVSANISSGIILVPPQPTTPIIEGKQKKSGEGSRQVRPKTSKKSRSKTKHKEPSSSTEALISEHSSSSLPEESTPPILTKAGSKPDEKPILEASGKLMEEDGESSEEKEAATTSKPRKKKSHGRSKSAKNGNKVEPRRDSSGKKQDEDDDEENGKPRPYTANDRWSTKEISNMNKLVAWDRPEDDI